MRKIKELLGDYGKRRADLLQEMPSLLAEADIQKNVEGTFGAIKDVLWKVVQLLNMYRKADNWKGLPPISEPINGL